jgi:hypothetical protein
MTSRTSLPVYPPVLGNPTQGFPIAAIQGEGGADSLAVVTPKLEAVGAPAPMAGIDGYPAIVTPLWAGRLPGAGQK